MRSGQRSISRRATSCTTRGRRPVCVTWSCQRRAGRWQREWAWRQIGLLAADDASPETDPQAAVLCALRRFPRDALDAVVVAVREVGIAAMHRLLGPGGWAALTVIVCAAAGYPVPPRRETVRGRADTPAKLAGRHPVGRPPASRTDSAAPPTDDASAPTRAAVVQLAGAAVARSALASAFVSAPIRPDARCPGIGPCWSRPNQIRRYLPGRMPPT